VIRYMAQAAAWGLSRLLREPRNQPFAHAEVEHAHWDPVGRRWIRHEHVQYEAARAA